MPVNQRPRWTVVEIASHAAQATSLTELTLPEVHRMAMRILNDEKNAPGTNQADPKPEDDRQLRQVIEDEYDRGFKRHSGQLD